MASVEQGTFVPRKQKGNDTPGTSRVACTVPWTLQRPVRVSVFVAILVTPLSEEVAQQVYRPCGVHLNVRIAKMSPASPHAARMRRSHPAKPAPVV